VKDSENAKRNLEQIAENMIQLLAELGYEIVPPDSEIPVIQLDTKALVAGVLLKAIFPHGIPDEVLA